MIFYRIWRAVLVPLAYLLYRMEIVGRDQIPKDGGIILAPTHRSTVDIAAVAALTRKPVRFLAKDEIFSSRLGNKVFRALGAIPVDRVGTDRGAIRSSRTAIEEGEVLGIFPEGTRRTGPEVSDLSDGCAYLALKLGTPLVPIGIGGTDRVKPAGAKFIRFPKVVVVVGSPIFPPVNLGVIRRSDLEKLTQELTAALQDCLNEAEGRANGIDASNRKAEI